MVRFLDLDNDFRAGPKDDPPPDDRDAPNLNLTNRFSQSLTCYPIASELATSLDLNTLHQLSRTCRQIRANLLQYRDQLIQHALRCTYDLPGPDVARPTSAAATTSLESCNPTRYSSGRPPARITSGKVGPCARDMIGECRRCGRVVCRNCIVKPPPTPMLKGRYRRLCRTCIKAPLGTVTTVRAPVQASDNINEPDMRMSYTRSPCECATTTWICQPCGDGLRAADTTYLRGWTWRSRYSTCGGLGAGLGEGNEGVECGQGPSCLAARVVEKDIECDADELAALEAQAKAEGRHWDGSSYTTQEIVGIGGRVKKKVTKLIPVGAIVKEYEDERAEGEPYLSREQRSAVRSWCAWCLRVVPSRKDLDEARSDATVPLGS